MTGKKALSCLIALFILCHAHASADPLRQAIETSKAGNMAEARTQVDIEKLDDQTQQMLDEYQRLSRELEQLVAYDEQLERMVASQQAEKESIAQQMQQLDLTQREVIPLMLRMNDWLQQLLQLDMPFLIEERQLRLEQLQQMMDRADISIGEKYRRILEAYLVEMEYGRTIEAYRGQLEMADSTRTVDFLRIGRTGLYYQSLDRNESGYWDRTVGDWKSLPDNYALAIRDGLRIARNQAAPDLLRLPVPAAVNAETQ